MRKLSLPSSFPYLSHYPSRQVSFLIRQLHTLSFYKEHSHVAYYELVPLYAT
ncbi:MAG: hypothetical protein IJK50_10410 [Prevotella sp.]|nr:hypothetical protein [Prevotella sp.]